jgi:gliding motility-associated-like protein
LPQVSVSNDTTICEGSSVTISGSASGGSGNYSYQWEPDTGIQSGANSASATVAPDSSRIYTLRVTDTQTGCKSPAANTQARVKVNILQEAVAQAGPNQVTVCEGDSVRIGHPTLGTKPDLTYSWSPSTDLANDSSGYTWASPTSTTNYTLSVSRSGCPGIDDAITVQVNPKPSVNLSPQVGPICPGDSTRLSPTVTGGATPYSYQWQRDTSQSGADKFHGDPAAFSDVTSSNPYLYSLRQHPPEDSSEVSDTADYRVIVTSAEGCRDTAGFSALPVAVPPYLDAHEPNEQNIIRYCRQDTSTGVTLQAGTDAANAQWVAGTGGNILNQTVNPTTTTDYVLEARYSNNCPVRDTVKVVVVPGIEAKIEADTTQHCFGDSIELRASGGIGAADFQWSPSAGLSAADQATVRANPGVSGRDRRFTYTVTVSEGGCEDTASITLTTHPQPEAQILASVKKGCAPLQVNFVDQGANSFNRMWLFGDGDSSQAYNPAHTYQDSGQYNVQLMSWTDTAQNCIDTATTQINVSPDLVANFTSTPEPGGQDTLFLPGATLQLRDSSQIANSWLWDMGDGHVIKGKNPSHTYNAPGVYQVMLVASTPSGCIDTVTKGPYIVQAPSTLNIPNVITPNGDGINDQLQPDYEGTEAFRMVIYNRWGKQVFSTDEPNDAWEGRLNGGQIVSSGLYFYVIEVGDKTYKGEVTVVR